MNRIRLCAPCLLSVMFASSALTADTLVRKLTELDLLPVQDYGFAKSETGELQFTLQNEAAMKKLATVEMPASDAPSSDQRFFQPDDTGRFTAVVSHDVLKQVTATPAKVPSVARWARIIDDLVTKASVAQMPHAKRTTEGTTARA